MKKVKKIKFYDFTNLNGAGHGGVNVYFYDMYGKLMMIDMSNSSINNTTYCETDKYIVTANGSYSYSGHWCRDAFHTGNTYKDGYLQAIGKLWLPPGYLHTNEDFLTFEFKTPIFLSDIKILHTFHSNCGFNTCKYEITYEDDTTYSDEFISDGKFNIYNSTAVNNYSYDQEKYDSQFKSINFNAVRVEFTASIGLIETDDTNCFKNINGKIKRLKCLYSKPKNTYIKFLISFDKRNSWKNFDGMNFVDENDISVNNIFKNGIDIDNFELISDKLINEKFSGDIDFRIILKTDNEFVSPSITRIYLENE